ncbi:MAG: TonB-dependent receptor, partial [Bacteroidaceae bacterium]
YDSDEDTFTDIPEIESTTLGFRSFLKMSDYSKLTLEYHHLGEKRRGGNKLNLPPDEADLAAEVKHSIDGGGVTYDLFSPDELYKLSIYASAQNADRDSYYGGYGHTKGVNALGGVQFTRNFKNMLFMPATLTSGAEYSYESLDDKTYSYNHSLEQTVNVASAYVQNEWKNEKWSFLAGARIDKHHFINHAVVSPRVNIRYNPIESINLRLGYGEGFRAPQAYDEDLHIGNVGERESIIELDPNLKEERSRSWSLSADTYTNLGDWNLNLMVDGFYTQLSNVFVLEALRETPDFLVKERTNGPGAKVWGMNLEGKAAYHHLFSLSAGATLQRSMYDKKTTWSSDEALASRKKTRTPNVYGYFMMDYHPTKLMEISMNGTYTGSMIVPHASISDSTVDQNVDSPSFFELGTKISYDFALTQSLNLTLSTGVNNMFNRFQNDFDKGANRDSDYIYGPRLPRTYYMECKISF